MMSGNKRTVSDDSTALPVVAAKKQVVCKAVETLEEKVIRLEKDRIYRAGLRQKETDEERQKRLKRDASQTAAARKTETVEERETRLKQKASQTAAAREAETVEEREARLKQNASQTAAAREAETVEERETRLIQKASQTAAARQGESAEERQERLQRMALNTALTRAHELKLRLKKRPLARLMINESDVPHSDIGSLNQQCIHCQAFHFADERKSYGFSTCCKNGKVRMDPSRILQRVPSILQNFYTDSTTSARN